MKKIQVEELKPGMRFDKPVYIDSENMFVGANVTIKEDDIKKLMKRGIDEIETTGDLISSKDEIKQYVKKSEESTSIDAKTIINSYNNLLKKRSALIKVHKETCSAVGNIYTAIKNGEKYSTDELELALENIINLLTDNNNIFLFLYGLDEGKFRKILSRSFKNKGARSGLGLAYCGIRRNSNRTDRR